MYLIWPICEAHGAHTGVLARQARVGTDSGSAKGLNRVVDDPERCQRRRHFNHGNFGAGVFVAQFVHHVGGFQGQKARHFNVDPGMRNALLPHRLFRNPFAKRHAGLQAPHHLLQCHFGAANRAHAMVDAPRPKAALSNFEAPAFTQKQVFHWHPHVFQSHFGVTVRRIVKTKHGQHAHNRDAGRIQGH